MELTIYLIFGDTALPRDTSAASEACRGATHARLCVESAPIQRQGVTRTENTVVRASTNGALRKLREESTLSDAEVIGFERHKN